MSWYQREKRFVPSLNKRRKFKCVDFVSDVSIMNNLWEVYHKKKVFIFFSTRISFELFMEFTISMQRRCWQSEQKKKKKIMAFSHVNWSKLYLVLLEYFIHNFGRYAHGLHINEDIQNTSNWIIELQVWKMYARIPQSMEKYIRKKRWQ